MKVLMHKIIDGWELHLDTIDCPCSSVEVTEEEALALAALPNSRWIRIPEVLAISGALGGTT